MGLRRLLSGLGMSGALLGALAVVFALQGPGLTAPAGPVRAPQGTTHAGDAPTLAAVHSGSTAAVEPATQARLVAPAPTLGAGAHGPLTAAARARANAARVVVARLNADAAAGPRAPLWRHPGHLRVGGPPDAESSPG